MGFSSEHRKYVGQRDTSEVLSLTDLERHDPESPLRQPERRFLCPLPSCSGHQKPREHRSLSVKTVDGIWKCHRCGSGGKLAEFRTDAMPEPTYAPTRRRARRELKPDPTIAECPLDDIRKEWLSKQPRLSSDAATPGREYLKMRGLDIEECIAARIKYTPDFKGRRGVIFPMYGDIRCKVLGGAQIRFIDNSTGLHRMETFQGSNMKQTLFMTSGAIPEDRTVPWTLCVTEAPIDALSLSCVGIPAVATVGKKSALPDWVMHVLKFPAFVILATDNDDAGRGMAVEFQKQIHGHMASEHFFRMPPGCPEHYRKAQSMVVRHPRSGKDWNEVLVNSGVDNVRYELDSDPDDPSVTFVEWMKLHSL